MKLHVKIFCTFFVFLPMLHASDVNSKIEALAEFQRPYKPIVIDYNPFVKESTLNHSSISSTNHQKKQELQLVSIINNRAFIGGNWYRVGDKIDGGKVIRIDSQKVDIQKATHIQTLRFEESKNVLHVKDSHK